MKPRLSFRCSEELIEEVDVARGREKREPFLRRIVEEAVGSAATCSPMSAATGTSSPSPRRPDSDPLMQLGATDRQRRRKAADRSDLDNVPDRPRPFGGQPGPNVEPVVSSARAKQFVEPRPKQERK